MTDGELEFLRARVQALEETKRKLDAETGTKYKRLEARLLAELERVRLKLRPEDPR